MSLSDIYYTLGFRVFIFCSVRLTLRFHPADVILGSISGSNNFLLFTFILKAAINFSSLKLSWDWGWLFGKFGHDDNLDVTF